MKNPSDSPSGTQNGSEFVTTAVDRNKMEAATSPAYEPGSEPQPEGKTAEDSGPREVNVVLVSHPESQLLGRRFTLKAGSNLVVGRSPRAQISLPDVLSLSRKHARVSHDGDRVTIEDLGSTNGTYVNDELIAAPTELKSGDAFQVGAVYFKLLYEADVETAYHKVIHQLMQRDGLTGIYNVREFHEQAQREFARATHYQRPLSLVFIDIDRFSSVNEDFGHLCGDFVLKQIARMTSELLRPEEVFARVGGGRFAILSPEAPAGSSSARCELLRKLYSSHRFEHADNQARVTCSFGVAELSPEMKSLGDLYYAAKEAAGLATQEGGNRVKVHSSPSR